MIKNLERLNKLSYFRPARSLEPQISIDDRRRSELAGILRDNDSREDVRNI
jgi:hypothetical protein